MYVQQWYYSYLSELFGILRDFNLFNYLFNSYDYYKYKYFKYNDSAKCNVIV